MTQRRQNHDLLISLQAIARALYAKPTIAIFDDSLSGLDSKTERTVFNRVFGRQGLFRKLGATVIFATHASKY